MTPFCRVKWFESGYYDGAFERRMLHGVLMSEVVLDPSSRRWLCIVATTLGNREMNALDLTVTGVWVPGEPLEMEA